MAQIDLTKFEKTNKERSTIQDPVPVKYSAYTIDNVPYLQLDMYGRQGEGRKLKWKVTQVTQFTPESAKKLTQLFLENHLIEIEIQQASDHE